MRPPDLPGGNICTVNWQRRNVSWGFNEAAGFTRRKPADVQALIDAAEVGFNEAAGFTRRKPVRSRLSQLQHAERFNEAAGFTRRKHVCGIADFMETKAASMRPPDLPGGNELRPRGAAGSRAASMRPPDLPGGNPT